MKKITLLAMLMTFLMSFTLSAQETHVYSVAGTPKALFGSDDDWDPTFTGTEMMLNGNVYEWTSGEVELNGETEVKFKVVEDHDWAVSYGLQGETGEAANMICNVETHGYYTLKVTFDPENDNLVTGKLTLVEELPNTYTIVGAPAVLFAGHEWDPNNEAAIMQLGDNGLYVWTSELGELTTEDNPYADQGPGHVEFKVLVNHDWNVSYPVANCSLAIPANGKYYLKATFDPETHEVSGELIPDDPNLFTQIYMVGNKINQWQWDTPEGRLPLTYNDGAFEVIQTLETGDEFKFIAPLVAEPDDYDYSDWKWFGGVDDSHVSNFWVTEDFVHGTWPINMITNEGTEHSFLMTVTGTFKFRIISMANDDDVTLRAPVGSAGVREPLALLIYDIYSTAITDITADKSGNDIWYNLAGMKLIGKPNEPGFYINNGNKVVIK